MVSVRACTHAPGVSFLRAVAVKDVQSCRRSRMANSPYARLRPSAEIAIAMNRSRRAVGRHVVIHVKERPSDDMCAVAVIASRKVGNAVQRNRAKRVIRAALHAVRLTGGKSVVVVARPSCARVPMIDVARELERLAVECELTFCGSVA